MIIRLKILLEQLLFKSNQKILNLYFERSFVSPLNIYPNFQDGDSMPSPLYDEDDSEVLSEFPTKFTGDGWELMVRYPIKKKIMSDRCWKSCYVELRDNRLFLFNSKIERKPFMEILLQVFAFNFNLWSHSINFGLKNLPSSIKII